jgi:phenylalanine-4-hydroxylase
MLMPEVGAFMAAPRRSAVHLPSHLSRYVAVQDYGAYTPRDQAVWRHILRRLTSRLEGKAHPSYLTGLAAAGIGVECIPSLEEMDAQLAGIGWRAVPVRGFIPPAVFTELQSLGVLAIAADIRTHEHVEYTPAPDIIHESAGHAPILADARYAQYLKRCGVAGFRAIASREDQAVFEAIRHLSVVKEDPEATPADTAQAQAQLRSACASRTYVSESAKASRLYWWTAEYGLVGDPEHPLLYGAGLLSSIGEAEHCLTSQVKKLPLSLDCVEQDFDITRMQPQLYVARDFDHLFEVLEAFETTLACARGGDSALEEALRARTVNHLTLSGGLEVTGQVARLLRAGPEGPVLLAVLEGPGMLSRRGIALGEAWQGPALVLLACQAPPPGPFSLDLPGGGSLQGLALGDHQATGLRGFLQGRQVELPGQARLFGGQVAGVAGGPGDPERWDRWFGRDEALAAEREAENRARQRKAQALPLSLAALYTEVRRMRQTGPLDPGRLAQIREELREHPQDWLLQCEIQELLGPSATPKAMDSP